jgi:hypothetical protein
MKVSQSDNNMAMLSWQIGKLELREMIMWSWATWKRGMGNLAEHRVFCNGACKNNLVYSMD